MSGTTPVVVSRIQNRRGTQAQFDALASPKLEPGELALCTDSRKIFIGNVNGEVVELATADVTDPLFNPVTIFLSPTSVWTEIIELRHIATPYLRINYSISDATTTANNALGTNFSRNGEINVTAVIATTLTPTPPTPSPVLVDSSVEINSTAHTVDFMAQYDSTAQNIKIMYMHDFPGILTFSTATIFWTAL